MTKSKNLQLALKAEYFTDVKNGLKPFEFRLYNEYWKKRLLGREYDTITLTLGYPKKGDTERTLSGEYKGYTVIDMQHKEFGDKPVKVFALLVIHLTPELKECIG